MRHYGIIMAGGIGSRFWPVSTPEYPKQFHDLLGTGRSLLQKTFDRIRKIMPPENIIIATNRRYKDLIREQLPQLTEDQLLLESAMRNTAPCLLCAALKIREKEPDALMLVAPSDHWIVDETVFAADIKTAFDVCGRKDILMTLGILPTTPNTGYGYIQYDQNSSEAVKKVLRFTEKPDEQTARSFLEQGGYLWNAGIFAWRANSIITAFREHLPDMYRLFTESKNIEGDYALAENISIDYGILEKADNVCTLPAGFDWNDLGTWGALYRQLPKDENGNVVIGAKNLSQDARENMIYTSTGKRVVTNGLSGYIIVETGDTLLIIPGEREQDIKGIQGFFD